MPRIPCPISITCGSPDEVDDPRANFSSELPDTIRFGATGWAPPTIDPGLPPGDPPFVPNGYIAQGCVSICFSSVSQEEANLCAENQAYLCGFGQTGCNGAVCPTSFLPLTPARMFFNQVQQCTYTCPDGTLFITTIGAGTFAAPTQAEADQVAHDYACSIAAHSFICLGALTAEACLGSAYSSTATAIGGDLPLTFSIASGSLPPGLSLSSGIDSKSFTVSGITTTAGIYAFQIGVHDATGHTAFKVFTIKVTGIDNASLPSGQVGVAYAQTLTAVSMTVPLLWSISDGSLPAGLTLNSASGQIFGTPTTAETSAFTVSVTDGAGITCTHAYTITIAVACFVDAGFANNDNFFPQVTLGVAAGYNGGTGVDFVWFNRARFDQIEPTHPDFPVANGAVFGSFYPVTNRLWYMPLGGPAVQLGPLGGSGLNHWPPSESGLCGYIYTSAGINVVEVWSPTSGVLVTLGVGPAGAGSPDFAMGPSGDIFWVDLNTGFGHIWNPVSGDANMGVAPGGITRVGVATNGHAAIGGSGGGWHWNGVALVQRTVDNTSRISINASDEIVGMRSTGAFFWRWTSGTGYFNIGLPPGAVSGTDCWITDTGLIVVQANNGPWYYWNGVWGQLINLLPADSGITSLINVVWVDHAGYAHGGAIVGANTPDYIAKLCAPP